MLIAQEPTDHVVMTYGCDFAFTYAKTDYDALDWIIQNFNQRNPGIELRYSTPQKYVDELKKINAKFTEKEGFPVHRDDSFPYAQNKNEFWSGFFTTRPYFKSKVREVSQNLHSSLILAAIEIVNAGSKIAS